MSDMQGEKPAEVKYLRPDNSAISPVEGYTGTISFPLVMTLAMHKRLQVYRNKRVEDDESDTPRVGVIIDLNADTDIDGSRIWFMYDDVELAFVFGTVELTGPDGKKMSAKSVDDWPLPLAVWAAKCYREWENSQVRFRWNSAAGLAASNV